MKYSVKFRYQHTFVLMLSLLLIHTTAHTSEVTLASISNLDDDEFRSDEGNYFKLIKRNTHCKIEAHFFVSFENTLYSYVFNRTGLISGKEKTFRYNYQKDHEGSLIHVTDVYQYSSARYDLKDPVISAEIKKDFMRYKALFPQALLSQC